MRGEGRGKKRIEGKRAKRMVEREKEEERVRRWRGEERRGGKKKGSE